MWQKKCFDLMTLTDQWVAKVSVCTGLAASARVARITVVARGIQIRVQEARGTEADLLCGALAGQAGDAPGGIAVITRLAALTIIPLRVPSAVDAYGCVDIAVQREIVTVALHTGVSGVPRGASVAPRTLLTCPANVLGRAGALLYGVGSGEQRQVGTGLCG